MLYMFKNRTVCIVCVSKPIYNTWKRYINPIQQSYFILFVSMTSYRSEIRVLKVCWIKAHKRTISIELILHTLADVNKFVYESYTIHLIFILVIIIKTVKILYKVNIKCHVMKNIPFFLCFLLSFRHTDEFLQRRATYQRHPRHHHRTNHIKISLLTTQQALYNIHPSCFKWKYCHIWFRSQSQIRKKIEQVLPYRCVIVQVPVGVKY